MTAGTIQGFQIYRLLCFAGPQYNEDGDVIISEEEFLEIKRLKELKQQYRQGYDELKNLKAEVQYCQKLVDQCRQRLINGKLIYIILTLYSNINNVPMVDTCIIVSYQLFLILV